MGGLVLPDKGDVVPPLVNAFDQWMQLLQGERNLQWKQIYNSSYLLHNHQEFQILRSKRDLLKR